MSLSAPKSILYVGAKSGTSLQRAEALRRRGHDVTHISPYPELPHFWAAWLAFFGGIGLDALVAHVLRRQIADRHFDLAHVDSGDIIGPRALRALRRAAPKLSNYNADNPYHHPSPERLRWALFRRAARGYDLNVAIKRDRIEQQMRALGVRNPLTIWQCADEATHFPVESKLAAEGHPSTAVVFVGTWMPGRDAFVLDLIEHGLELTVYGPRWERAPHYTALKDHVQVGYLSGAAYRNVIAQAKIALVLLNEANHDLHTTRSAEIPAMRVVICAPRTSHHLHLYEDDREAIFFADASECARKCLNLLSDEARRAKIAEAGYQKTFSNGTYNEILMSRIVDALST